MDWLPLPDTCDFTIRKIVDDLYDVARGEVDSIDLQIRITNNKDCRSTGQHWFTIAYAIQLVPGTDRAALTEAVRAAAETEVRLQTNEERRRISEILHEFMNGVPAPGTEEPHDAKAYTTEEPLYEPELPQQLESEDELEMQQELQWEIEAELEADLEAEALLEAEE